MCLVAGSALGQQATGSSGAAAAEALSALGAGALEGTVGAEDYTLGPGDILQIGFWGEVNRSETVTVNPDGDALIPPAGPLRLAGLTLAEARGLIARTLAEYYRPDILSVSLISLRKFQIHVVGLVAKPGALEVDAVTRVSQAVALAGGLEADGSLRNVSLARPTGAVRVDLARYLLLGDNAANPFLTDGDVVRVPRRAETIGVYGAVNRGGEYEFVDGETLTDAIDLAGGFGPDAREDSLELQRFREDDPSVSEQTLLAGGPVAFGRAPRFEAATASSSGPFPIGTGTPRFR